MPRELAECEWQKKCILRASFSASQTEIIIVPGAALVLLITAVIRGIALASVLAAFRLVGRFAFGIAELEPLGPRLLAQLLRAAALRSRLTHQRTT